MSQHLTKSCSATWTNLIHGCLFKESGKTQYAVLWLILSEMERAGILSSTKMTLSTPYSSPKSRTTQIQIGNQNLSMLGQVSRIEPTIPRYFLTKFNCRLPSKQAERCHQHTC